MDLTRQDFDRLNAILAGRIGVAYPASRMSLLSTRLIPRLSATGTRTFSGYIRFLERAGSEAMAEEMRQVAPLVTNQESYFFRETWQTEALIREGLQTLPGWDSGKLRMLCAGCCRGEEPYTLGILLRKHGGRWSGKEIAISAFDLVADRLDAARKATYGPNALRAVSQEHVCTYFERAGGEAYRLKEAHRGEIRFFPGNLLDPATYSAPLGYDVVFCRNVLLYFSAGARAEVAGHLWAVLKPGGVLCLGHSESLEGIPHGFESFRLGRSIVYRKAALPP